MQRSDADGTGAPETRPGRADPSGCPSVVVGIATASRPHIVAETVNHLLSLSDGPDRIVISVAQLSDVDIEALARHGTDRVEILLGPQGASVQRNSVLDTLPDVDVILFLDDDYLIEDGYMTSLRALFADHGDMVMATGEVLADGLRGPGFAHADGIRMLAEAPPRTAPRPPKDVYSVYGCNMAVRTQVANRVGARFDAALPLYSWLEDVGFSRQMAAHGRIVRDPRLRGVHLATKVGRRSGLRLGYSQIANPIHLVRSGTLDLGWALGIMTRNFLTNVVKSLWPEPWIDRHGRLRGNLMAFRDIIRRRCHPTRVIEIDDGPRPIDPGGVSLLGLDAARRLSPPAQADGPQG